MTNKYFTYDLDLIPGQTARSGQIDSTFQAIETSLDVLESDVFRTVRFTADVAPVEGTFQIAESAPTRANRILGFDALGNIAVVADAGSWSGDWAASTAYLARSFVRAPESHFFSIYIATVGHTSDASFAVDLAAGRWELMIDMSQIYASRIRHQLITDAQSPFAATSGNDLMIDTTAGPVTVTLPGSPLITDAPINIMHVAGDLSVNPITIARNGNRIMGLQEDMTVVTVTNASFGLAYCNAALGWRIRGV